MEYIYIVQGSLEMSSCKIGITDNLERRLKEYNNMTGKSKENVFTYLFACEVVNMRDVENDIKKEFIDDRQVKSSEMYFYNEIKFDKYVNFIKSHKLFIKEIAVKKDKEKVIVVRKKEPILKEKGINKKYLLQLAKKVKNDEFYTRYEDVEKEVEHHKEFFENKVVFCNCDDPYVEEDESKSSAFALYFYKNFKKLKLKKLICTHYSGGVDLFSQGKSGIIYTTDGKKWNQEMPKNFAGSFDDPLSIKILKEEADIVCTNPPFSRAIEYWKLVIESKKRFLIISPMTCAINTSYIKHIKNKKVWTGINRVDFFINPKLESVGATCFWYTNMEIKDRPRYNLLKFALLKDIPDKYKKFDDNGILNTEHCYIPTNYDKEISVSCHPIFNGILEKGYEIVLNKQYEPYVNGKRRFGRVLIQKIKI